MVGLLGAPSKTEAADESVEAFYSAARRGDEVLMARQPAPSPDGSQIAFSYQGDLWTVSSSGGDARRLTAHPGREAYPMWSPDGSRIAFSSDRNGNDDVFVLSLEEGRVEQLTFDSDGEYVTDWTADGQALLIQNRGHVRDGRNAGIWLLPLSGGNPGFVQPVGGRLGALSPDGTRLAFVRGSTAWWRRGYEGPGRYRLYLHELEAPLTSAAPHTQVRTASVKNAHTQMGDYADLALRPNGRYVELSGLASERGEPRSQHDRNLRPDFDRPSQESGANANPFWFPDGEHLLYLSEIHGVTNLKLMNATTGTRAWITRFENGDGRLRHPQLSEDGSLAVFEYEDGIYAVDVPATLPAAGSTTWSQPPSDPRRISIRLPLDERMATVGTVTVKSDASESEPSPDDEQIAFVHEGDIFAMKASKDEPWAYALTSDPSRDRDIMWSPDSKSLVFVSDRTGNQDIFVVTSGDPNESRLCRTLQPQIKQLTDSPEPEEQLQYSPDGKRIAFVRGPGTLMTMKADGGDEKVIVDGWAGIDYQWSPDGKWFVFARQDDDFNTDIHIIASDGSGEPYNLSRHPDDDYSPYWSADGRVIAFVSTRKFPNQTDIWYARLSKEDWELTKEDRLDAEDAEKANKGKGDGKEDKDGKDKKDGKKDDKKGDKDGSDDEKDLPEVVIDFDGLHERIVRLTSFPGSESRVWVTPDAEEFLFRTDTDGKTDLWKIRWDGEEEERVTSGGTNPRSVRFDSKGKRIFYRKGSGSIHSVSLSGKDSETYRYEAEKELDRFGRRRAVFVEAWRELRDNFYDPEMHGADWNEVRERFDSWAEAASTYADFRDVIKMMLGEVGASHMNVYGGPGDVGESLSADLRLDGPGDNSGFAVFDDDVDGEPIDPSTLRSALGDFDGWIEDLLPEADLDPVGEDYGTLSSSTAELGVFFDPSFRGPGMRVTHVVPNGPADRASSRLEVGDVVRKIDGRETGPNVHLSQLLDRKSDKKVRLEVERNGKTRQVILRPVSRGTLRNLLYDAEVAMRQQHVADVSEDRVAYVHIRGMSVPSLEDFERDLFAQAHGKDALIIDVRDNGGGWTTDLMMTSLAAADHAVTIPRGGGKGYPEDRRLMYAWSKPIVVLCNEFSFSNAEIFSWAVQTTDRGPVVGTTTYGGVISTGGTTLADGTWLRLPFRGWYTKGEEVNMERVGCTPDYPVYSDPNELVIGNDPQLAAAVQKAIEQLR